MDDAQASFYGSLAAATSNTIGAITASGTSRRDRKFASSENQKNRDYNTMMYERQLADNRENWKMQNEYYEQYNSPTAQMQRYKDAGLNPYMMMQNGGSSSSAVGSSISSTSAGSPGTSALPTSQPLAPYFSNMGSILNGMFSQIAQINNLNSTTNRNNSELPFLPEFYRSRNYGMSLSNTGSNLSNQAIKLQNKFNEESYESRLQSLDTQTNIQKATQAGLLLDNETKKFLNSVMPPEHQAELMLKYQTIAKTMEDVHLSRKQQKYIDQQITNLITEDLLTTSKKDISELEKKRLKDTSQNVIDCINATNKANEYKSLIDSNYYRPLSNPNNTSSQILRGYRYINEFVNPGSIAGLIRAFVK